MKSDDLGYTRLYLMKVLDFLCHLFQKIISYVNKCVTEPVINADMQFHIRSIIIIT